MGAIGIILGVGLSFAVDAIAGSDLSDPVPVGITSVEATHRTAESPEAGDSSAPASAADDDGVREHAGASAGVASRAPMASGGSDGGSSPSPNDGDSDDAHSARSTDSSHEGEDD